MAKERLSKLQKWILVRAYKNHEGIEGSHPETLMGDIAKIEIYRDYFGLFCRTRENAFYGKAFFTKDPGTKPVILSRSLWNLARKGFIYNPNKIYRNEEIKCEYKGNMGYRHKPGRFFDIALTEEGEEKAKELLENGYNV